MMSGTMPFATSAFHDADMAQPRAAPPPRARPIFGCAAFGSCLSRGGLPAGVRSMAVRLVKT